MSELMLMMHDAQHSKGAAKAELERLDMQLQEDRKRRDRELAERKSQVRAAQALTRSLIDKEHARLEAIQKAQQERQAEASLPRGPRQSLMGTTDAHGRRYSSASQDPNNTPAMYEEGFEKIRHATGIHDVGEILAKFELQNANQRQFSDLNKAAQARVDQLNAKVLEIKQGLEQQKYAVGAGLGRAVVDEAESKLRESEDSLEQSRRHLDRLARLALSMRVGTAHLLDIVSDTPGAATSAAELPDEHVPDALVGCEERLSKLFDEVPQEEDEFQKELEAARAASDRLASSSRNMHVPSSGAYGDDGFSDQGSGEALV